MSGKRNIILLKPLKSKREREFGRIAKEQKQRENVVGGAK
jgi:hypothetical protein